MDSYVQSRAEGVHNIEQTISQLGNMYRELIELVDKQHETVIRIDDNVRDTLENVNAGYEELTKLHASASGGQWLVLKAFAILMFFAIFFFSFVF